MMNYKIFFSCIVAIPLITIHLLTSKDVPSFISKHSPEYFYTDRNDTLDDTLYLPIEEKCLIRVDVFRYIDKVEKIDNRKYVQETHLSIGNSILLDNQQDVKEFCYIPIRYKRIFPFFTSIYNVECAEEIRYDKTKEQLWDAVHIRLDTTYNIHYWGAEYRTDIGDAISDYMPLIEMFLWQKITKETTLVNEKQTLISESFFIHILPSKI